ncbi:MAG: hypothetical protein JXR58_05305 [Bacteroidales bacterium]|nr:hypothetical protein [Bacteroidales bacterium]
MKLYNILVFILLLISFIFSCKTKDKTSSNLIENPRGDFRIMFYNVENLFDTYDDPQKNDDEFLPEGTRYWSNYRMYDKLRNISKVIVAIGEWETPEIIGFCEIENRFVLEKLVENSPLVNLNYKIIHFESPDRRGIDVGIIYNSNRFKPLFKQAIEVVFPYDTARKTRDILYVKGVLGNEDTVHVFVNHWPSRYGGQMVSEPGRITAAGIVRKKVDSIMQSSPLANIVITGDFNDEPENISMSKILRANTKLENFSDTSLYNIAAHLLEKGRGTHKYQGNWGVLDQFIVPGTMITGKSTLNLKPNNMHVFEADFLLEKDENAAGNQPFRTYVGFKYNGGFSDHLPVYIDLFKSGK